MRARPFFCIILSRLLRFRLKLIVAVRKDLYFLELSRIFSSTPFCSRLPGCHSLHVIVKVMWAWLRVFVVKFSALFERLAFWLLYSAHLGAVGRLGDGVLLPKISSAARGMSSVLVADLKFSFGYMFGHTQRLPCAEYFWVIGPPS